MCTWRGFEVDPCWGAFRMAGELLLAIKRQRSTHADTYCIHVDTHSWRQSETEEWQYSMRQESGLQSTIPASSYLVGSILETRPNQTRQVRSVKKHGFFFFWFGTHTLLSLGYLSFTLWSIIAISHDINGLFHHLHQKCNSKSKVLPVCEKLLQQHAKTWLWLCHRG